MLRSLFLLTTTLWLANLPDDLAAGKDPTGSPNDLIISEVRAALTAQQAAWNRGDIDTFTKTYDPLRR
jgi:hypothetical protein